MAEVVVSRNTFLIGLVVAILASSLLSTVISSQLTVGPQGSKGDQGVQGLQGVQGTQGEVGPQGDEGLAGSKGDTGDAGPQGEDGSIGPQGLPGLCPWENGSISISAAAFAKAKLENFSYLPAEGGRAFWAPVQLPHQATIVNITAYLYDNLDDGRMMVELWGYNLTENSSLGVMAHIETSWEGASTEMQVLYNDTVSHARIDNENCIYALKELGTGTGEILYFRAVVIEYKYLG